MKKYTADDLSKRFKKATGHDRPADWAANVFIKSTVAAVVLVVGGLALIFVAALIALALA